MRSATRAVRTILGSEIVRLVTTVRRGQPSYFR
jgi:hypothetical protein